MSQETAQATQARLSRTLLVGYLLAGAASIAYGASLVLAKQVVQDTPPLVGSTLGMVFGVLVLSALSARDIRRDKNVRLRGYVWAGLGGWAAAGGITLMFLAMSHSPVVVVAPIVAVNPLTAIFFGQIFIRGMERLTWRLFIGAVMVVAGVIVIGLGQNT